MKVDHLTFLGTSYVRDSLLITLYTLNLLKQFQITDFRETTLKFPRTLFDIRITTWSEGAVFDIQKLGLTAFTNFCCFDPCFREVMMDYTQEVVHKTFDHIPIKTPRTEEFLYTIPVMPTFLTPTELKVAAEIEFYIYYSLFLGRKKHENYHDRFRMGGHHPPNG